nr:MAG TPA: hypothetical protein [Crassvirales sp.]
MTYICHKICINNDFFNLSIIFSLIFSLIRLSTII